MYPKAYIHFLAHFHCSRDYFECHEILEEYWKQNKKRVWLALIQIAVSLYHYRRGNMKGASKMLASALRASEEAKEELEKLALNYAELTKRLHQLQTNIIQLKPFADLNLPISDEKLLQLCKSECAKMDSPFAQKSDLTNEQLVEKHRLRDRQDVIALRLHRLNEKSATQKNVNVHE